MLTNRRTLIDACHEAFWSFPEDTLGSDRRIAAVLATVADSMLSGQLALHSKTDTCQFFYDIAHSCNLVRVEMGSKQNNANN
jgi:hypothetical protein